MKQPRSKDYAILSEKAERKSRIYKLRHARAVIDICLPYLEKLHTLYAITEEKDLAAKGREMHALLQHIAYLNEWAIADELNAIKSAHFEGQMSRARECKRMRAQAERRAALDMPMAA